MKAAAVGVDGCRAGWVAAWMEGGRPRVRVCADVAELWAWRRSAGLGGAVLIDVPIGLSVAERTCDVQARRVLGARRSSVFRPPWRGLLELEYGAANALSREVRGAGLSKQSFNIFRKIREVDEFVRGADGARGVLRECHPELCFSGLSGAPMSRPKRTAEGAAERLCVLSDELRLGGAWFERVRRMVSVSAAADDDLIDALVALAAASAEEQRLRVLPEEREVDECGLAMEMVYAARAEET